MSEGVLHLFEEPFVMKDLVAQPLDGRGDDGGLARVPDADGGHVRQAEDLGTHHFRRSAGLQHHISSNRNNDAYHNDDSLRQHQVHKSRS